MNVGTVKVSIGADTSGFSSRLREVNTKLNALGKNISSSMSTVASAVGAVTAALGALGGAVAKVGIEYNSMKEQALIAWETILGSAQEAEKTVRRLEEMGAYTPFEYADLDKAAKKLQMAGFEGERLFQTLTYVGDAVSAIGGGADELNGIATALFQISTKGKLSAEEMNQLAERGIPAWAILAEQQGKSVREMMKLSEQGKLFADEVLPQLLEGLGERFGGAMEKQSKTFRGMMDTLRNEAKMFAGSLTEGLFEGLKFVLPSIIKSLQTLHNAFKSGGFSGLFKEIFPPSVVQAAQTVFNALKGYFNWYKNTAISLTQGEGNLGESFTRIFNALKSIAIPIFQDVLATFKNVASRFKTLWDENGDQIVQAVKTTWSVIASIIEFTAPIILFVVQMVWDAIKNIIIGATDVIIGAIKIFTGIMTADWAVLWEGTKQQFLGAIQTIWGIMNVLFFGKILKGIKFLASGAWVGIRAMWSGIVNFFRTGVTNVVNTATNMWQSVVNAFNFLRSTGLNIFQSFRAMVSIVWQSIRLNVVSAANALLNGVRSAFHTVLNTARNIFNSVKSAITNPIQSAKNTVISIINSIKNAFSQMKITIPKPKLPKISVTMKTGVMGIPYPDFNVSWKASGGIFTGASIIGVGEKGDEAVVPLSQKHRMKPFAQAVADMMRDDMKASGEVIINNYFNIQATIREEADIQKMSEELNRLQTRALRAGGVRWIGGT